MNHIDPQEAFEAAIAEGVLSADPKSVRYAGAYMYMGTDASGHRFKHIDTREYTVPVPARQ